MRRKTMVAMAGAAALALPAIASATTIVAYNFGPSSSQFTYAETTINPDVTASGVNAGATTTESQDNGVGGTTGWYSNNPGGNYLSVANSSATTDNGYWVDFSVTAAPGYVFTPTNFTMSGGAGGSSNLRSYYIFDNVDGLPTSITPNTSSTATVSGGDLLASGTFTTQRGVGGSDDNPPMQAVSVTDFTAADQNLSTFTIAVYFDTQGGTGKNIDIGNLELDGTVTATPEPASLGLLGIGALVGLGMRRPRRSPDAPTECA